MQDKLEEALTRLHKALMLNPESADVHNNLGIAFKKKEQYVQALKHYQKDIELDKGNAAPCFNIGIVLVLEGRLEEAFQMFKRTSEIDPENKYVEKPLKFVQKIINRKKKR